MSIDRRTTVNIHESSIPKNRDNVSTAEGNVQFLMNFLIKKKKEATNLLSTAAPALGRKQVKNT